MPTSTTRDKNTTQRMSFGQYLADEARRAALREGGVPEGVDCRWVVTGWTPSGVPEIDPAYWLVDALAAAEGRLDFFRGVMAIRSTKTLPDPKGLAVAWTLMYHPQIKPSDFKRVWSTPEDYEGPKVTVGTVWHYAVESGWDPPEAPDVSLLSPEDAVLWLGPMLSEQEVRLSA